MSADARFEDGGEQPLRLRALAAEDLAIIAALVQDAVLPANEMRWDRRARRFGMLLNRFRWEDREAAQRTGRAFERVQSVLAIEDVMAVATLGFDRDDGDLVLSVLDIRFEPGEDGQGRVLVSLSGDGELAITVEALEVRLRDVTRPYAAPSGKAPKHD